MTEPLERWAVLSDDARYRYELGRRWPNLLDGGGRGRIVWVMLNPSIADASVDDQTVRRCVHYSRRDGFDDLAIVNLYAYRATKPVELGRLARDGGDPMGPENADYLDRHLADAAMVVAAWGAHPMATKIADDLLGGHRPLYCLGTTAGGHPRHPARLGNDVPLEVWRS